MRAAAGQIMAAHDEHRPADQQRRRDGDPRGQDRRRLRDAVRRRPPGPLVADRAAAARAAARTRRADRDRDQHGPSHGPCRRPGQPAPARPLPAVARLRPGEARELPLRPRASARAGEGRRGHGQPDRAPGAVEHRPAGGQRARDRRRREPAVLPLRSPAAPGCPPADGALSQLRAATDPAAKGGEFYGPLFVNNGPPVRKPIVRRLGMDKAIAALWEVSERETGIAIDVRAAAA